MGTGVDKLFLDLAGRPVVAHTWLNFDGCECVDEIILVVRAGLEASFDEIGKALDLTKPHRLVVGGRERQDSVWNGLQAVSSRSKIIAIQDGARPCTSRALVAQVMAAAGETGAAVAAHRVTDTIKQADGSGLIEKTLDRSRLWSVQTPQAFQAAIIRKAMEVVRQSGAIITDDTAACELIGQPVKLVESAAPNPKITSPADLPFVEMLLASSSPASARQQ